MGYESKIYVVSKGRKYDGEERRYAQVIAMYDMCKIGGFQGIFNTITDCYIYSDDGNTEIIKDKYGDFLREDTIENVIKYLENYQNTQEHYRRVDPLLALLKSFNTDEWKDLTVLHYGY